MSYLTKFIWFGWVSRDYIRLETIARQNIYDMFRQKSCHLTDLKDT
jgi:hypothetical protein